MYIKENDTETRVFYIENKKRYNNKRRLMYEINFYENFFIPYTSSYRILW